MAGGVPQGWEIVELGELIGKITAGTSVNCDDRRRRGDERGMLKLGAVTSGVFKPEVHKVALTGEAHRLTTPVRAGTILFNRKNTPDLVGQVAKVDREADGLFLPDLIWELVPSAAVDADWLLQWLRSERFRAQMFVAATGSSQSMVNVSQDALRQTTVLRPPLPEQRRIAAVLDAWDRAIAAAERAAGLARRRADGLRANLLGRRQQARAGDNHWAAHEFGAITREEARRNNGALGTDRVMGVLKSEGLVPMRAHVMAADLGRYKRVPPAAFAYNPMRLNIGSLAMSAYREDVLVSPDYVVFSVDDAAADPRLIRHLTHTRAWSDHLARTGSGSVRTRIYYDDLAEMAVFLPSRAEQARIADILDDADRATEGLAGKATLLRTQKRALMQRLLTGAQRLGPEFDAVAAAPAADAA
ncbi:MAG: restriction endonuclease subunit S [Salinarimonas sp.]